MRHRGMREKDEVEREGEERGQEQGEPSRAVILNLPNPETLKQSSSCYGTPNNKIIFLLLHNCHFATVINSNIHSLFFMVLREPYDRVDYPP